MNNETTQADTTTILAEDKAAFEIFIKFTRPGWLQYFEKDEDGNYTNEITLKLFGAWMAGVAGVGLDSFKVLMEDEPRPVEDWLIDAKDPRAFSYNRTQRLYWAYQVAKAGVDLSTTHIGAIISPVLEGERAAPHESNK